MSVLVDGLTWSLGTRTEHSWGRLPSHFFPRRFLGTHSSLLSPRYISIPNSTHSITLTSPEHFIKPGTEKRGNRLLFFKGDQMDSTLRTRKQSNFQHSICYQTQTCSWERQGSDVALTRTVKVVELKKKTCEMRVHVQKWLELKWVCWMGASWNMQRSQGVSLYDLDLHF